MNHYVYRINFVNTDYVYFGVRSCKCLPKDDVDYLGSPKTHKDYWEKYEPKKTILKEFSTREEAEEAERFLINWQWNSTDAGKELSLNVSIYYYSFNSINRKWSKEMRDKQTKPFTLYHAVKGTIQGHNLTKYALENNYNQGSLHNVSKGKQKTYNLHFKDSFSCNNWFKEKSLDFAINLYASLKNYKSDLKGVSFRKDRNSWNAEAWMGKNKCRVPGTYKTDYEAYEARLIFCQINNFPFHL